MIRPKLLDLFCGEGGAGMGYNRAGWDVYGVDNEPKRAKFYPFPVHVGDALEAFSTLLDGQAIGFRHADGMVEWLTLDQFILKHASPPCQGYSRGTVALPDRLDRYDRLIAAMRDLLNEAGGPWVIENVMGARSELQAPFMLCGRMFGLTAVDDDGTPLVLDRHRLFETSTDVMLEVIPPVHPRHDPQLQVAGVYGGARRDKREAREVRKGGYVPPSIDVLKALIGADWMSEQGLFLSIPPAYSEWIGRQLIGALEAVA